MLTKESLLALFAAYPNNNQNTVREFIDYIFTLTPGVPGGYLPLSGGTMTGNVDFNFAQLQNAVLQGATKLGSAQSIISPSGNEQLTFGSTLNPSAVLTMNAGAEGFMAGGGIGINNTKMFNAVGSVGIGDLLALAGNYLWFQTLGVDLTHGGLININSGGNMNLGAGAGASDITFTSARASFVNTLLGFFNVAAVAQATALTAPDATVLSTGGAAVLQTADSDVIDNIRTRVNELETKFQAYGLLQ